jgi:hypothetical protein
MTYRTKGEPRKVDGSRTRRAKVRTIERRHARQVKRAER